MGAGRALGGIRSGNELVCDRICMGCTAAASTSCGCMGSTSAASSSCGSMATEAQVVWGSGGTEKEDPIREGGEAHPWSFGREESSRSSLEGGLVFSEGEGERVALGPPPSSQRDG